MFTQLSLHVARFQVVLECSCSLMFSRLSESGAAACTAVFRMFHYGSGRANWGTFAERVRAYHGVCGSLAADLAFSCAAFVAFAVCAGTETAITTLWPWKVREYAQREWEKDRKM